MARGGGGRVSASGKRIVLVGYPGAGKTMLAIGLFNSAKIGASITIPDPAERRRLSEFTANLLSAKTFPAATQISGDDADCVCYLFDISWRGKMHRVEFLDYAGERTSNPDFSKRFDEIIGSRPDGAILLLNPGMAAFDEEPSAADGKIAVMNAGLVQSYTSIVNKLCGAGCRKIVLAITASDRLSRGGDLHEKTSPRRRKFSAAVDEIECALKQSAKTCGVIWTRIPVTVTGRIADQNPGSVGIAEGAGNTSAEPFLWIIDPLRDAVRKWTRRLAWGIPFAAAMGAGVFWGMRLWQGRQIDARLAEARAELDAFGDPSAANFDLDKGGEQMRKVEKSLFSVDRASKFFAGAGKSELIDETLPRLLGRLLTNQVDLAYRNALPRTPPDDFYDTNRTLLGADEFSGWTLWKSSARGGALLAAAAAYRDSKTASLASEYAKSNLAYLKCIMRKAKEGKNLPADERVRDLLKKALEMSLEDDELRNLRSGLLGRWIKDIEEGVRNDASGMTRAEKCFAPPAAPVQGAEGVIEKLKACDLERRKAEAEAETEKMRKTPDLQLLSAELYGWLSSCGESPYRAAVIDHVAERLNAACREIIAEPEKREERFDKIFHAVRKLDDRKLLPEGEFSHCAAFWLAKDTGVSSCGNDSANWLRHGFSCDAVEVKTDHKTHNPDRWDFHHDVDVNLGLDFSSKHEGFPRDAGGDSFIKEGDAKNGVPEPDYSSVPGTAVDVKINATEKFVVTVKEGKERWGYNKWGVPLLNPVIPETSLEFMPSWGDVERKFHYASRGDAGSENMGEYPGGADFCVRLKGVRIGGGPKEAFEKALENAEKRMEGLKQAGKARADAADKEAARLMEESRKRAEGGGE